MNTFEDSSTITISIKREVLTRIMKATHIQTESEVVISAIVLLDDVANQLDHDPESEFLIRDHGEVYVWSLRDLLLPDLPTQSEGQPERTRVSATVIAFRRNAPKEP